jgi:hypothetical protein
MSVHCFPDGGALRRPRTRQRPKAGGSESYTKVRVSGCDKSGKWARRAGYLKDNAHNFLPDVQPPLPYSHRARRVAPRLHALFGCYHPPCEEVLQAAEREMLEENCGMFVERHLQPLQSAIGRLRRGPRLRGGEGRLKRNSFFRLCPVLASGLRGPLFGTFAPRYIGWTVLAMQDGAVGGRILRGDHCRL